jgi:hypothetical protein
MAGIKTFLQNKSDGYSTAPQFTTNIGFLFSLDS